MPIVRDLGRRSTATPRGLVGSCMLLWLTAGTLRAGERVDYASAVKPVFAAHCYACHGALQQKGGLRLDTAALVKQGGDKGPVVTVGDSSRSLLVLRVTGVRGGRMPPRDVGEALSEHDVALIRAWIDQGAEGPVGEKPEADPREHWAFRPPVRPPLPAVGDAARVRNPIDAFLAVQRDKHGLTPQPLADRRVLLRRVTLDLTGLPPTHAEQTAFLADDAADAYEKVVDRLLASPRYGERWGRHWMDVWRYSDWWGLGAEVRNSQKHIWHWRDWIVESLNADQGYDQMLREMLAADELYPNDLARLRATGYLARAYFKFNRNTWLEDVVEHTGKAFLGLTLNCAKCHDHKYDPVAQQDYYRFRAFFEPYQVRTDMLPGEIDFEKDGLPRAFDCNLGTPTHLFVRGDEKRPATDRPLSPGLPTLLAPGGLKIEPVSMPPVAHTPGLRSFVLDNYLREAERRIARCSEGVRLAQERLVLADSHALAASPAASVVVYRLRLAVTSAEKALAAAQLQPAALKAKAAAEKARWGSQAPAEIHELAQRAAEAESKAERAADEELIARFLLEVAEAPAGKRAEIEKKYQALYGAPLAKIGPFYVGPSEVYKPLRGSLKTAESNLETEASRSKTFPATSTGRRSALARWLTEPHNPLTARVAVNHIWARHFGRPLVPTVFDFGRKGTPPTHPELLDWLAVEFVESGWSMKHLHRLIVTSDAYRMTSSTVPQSAINNPQAIDPENRWYWRMNAVRMEAEVVRDSLLYLAGDLDATMGGPPIPVQDEASRRRSLYYFHSHNEEQKFLAMFDQASVLECYRRAESIVPQQALALENSGLARTAAEKIARRLGDVPDAAFVRAAFETVLAVPPTTPEQEECELALRQWHDLVGAARARLNLVHALLNHNDFITIR